MSLINYFKKKADEFCKEYGQTLKSVQNRPGFPYHSGQFPKGFSNNPATIRQQLCKNSATNRLQMQNASALHAERMQKPGRTIVATHSDTGKIGKRIKIFFRASEQTLNFWRKTIASLCCQRGLRIWRKYGVDATNPAFPPEATPRPADRSQTIF